MCGTDHSVFDAVRISELSALARSEVRSQRLEPPSHPQHRSRMVQGAASPKSTRVRPRSSSTKLKS